MTSGPENKQSLEHLLADLDRAERAGVFRPTMVDATELMNSPDTADVPWLYRNLRPAIAAAILLAAGVWTMMFTFSLGNLRNDRLAMNVESSQVASPVSFQECLAGPKGQLSAACKAHDVDGDGDVDLADLGSFQLAYAP